MSRKCIAPVESVLEALLLSIALLAASSVQAQPYPGHPVVRLLNAETNNALANPAIASKLAELGVVVTPGTADQFAAFITAQTELWSAVVKSAGIKPD